MEPLSALQAWWEIRFQQKQVSLPSWKVADATSKVTSAARGPRPLSSLVTALSCSIQHCCRGRRSQQFDASCLKTSGGKEKNNKKRSNSLDGDFNSPECNITHHHAHGGHFNGSSPRWASARLRLPFMIRGRAMQTFSPGKHVRGFAQRHPHTQQLAAWAGGPRL